MNENDDVFYVGLMMIKGGLYENAAFWIANYKNSLVGSNSSLVYVNRIIKLQF
jgi:hypothetical protein